MDGITTPEWTLRDFPALTTEALYDILRLRSEVFVVEQNCVFLDMDGKDFRSAHLMGRVDGSLVAYARILPPGLAYPEASIGRVVTAPEARRSGFGKALMLQALLETRTAHPGHPIRIGAQRYLVDFYGSFGFQPLGDVYLEDGIEHIEMYLGS